MEPVFQNPQENPLTPSEPIPAVPMPDAPLPGSQNKKKGWIIGLSLLIVVVIGAVFFGKSYLYKGEVGGGADADTEAERLLAPLQTAINQTISASDTAKAKTQATYNLIGQSGTRGADEAYRAELSQAITALGTAADGVATDISNINTQIVEMELLLTDDEMDLDVKNTLRVRYPPVKRHALELIASVTSVMKDARSRADRAKELLAELNADADAGDDADALIDAQTTLATAVSDTKNAITAANDATNGDNADTARTAAENLREKMEELKTAITQVDKAAVALGAIDPENPKISLAREAINDAKGILTLATSAATAAEARADALDAAAATNNNAQNDAATLQNLQYQVTQQNGVIADLERRIQEERNAADRARLEAELVAVRRQLEEERTDLARVIATNAATTSGSTGGTTTNTTTSTTAVADTSRTVATSSGAGQAQTGGSTTATAPEYTCAAGFEYDSTRNACVRRATGSSANANVGSSSSSTTASTQTASDEGRSAGAVASNGTATTANTSTASATRPSGLHGAYIRGETGPALLLYPLALASANGLLMLRRRRRNKK